MAVLIQKENTALWACGIFFPCIVIFLQPICFQTPKTLSQVWAIK